MSPADIQTMAIEQAHMAICEDSYEDCLEWRGRCVKAVNRITEKLTITTKEES